MILVANECANCRTAVGYVTEDALQIPTLCVPCVNDPEVLKEWGHAVGPNENPERELQRLQGRVRDVRDLVSEERR